ncbi:MAG TPA: hypothetical protein VFI20_09945, partial [Terracidiphilus sp.]|nr:hypothetical protein [Terracidiphilus sp.]
MVILLLQANLAFAVDPAAGEVSAKPQPETPAAPAASIPFAQLQKRSLNPFDAYRGTLVPQPIMTNSDRLQSLVRNGKLYLSLDDAISLALENNLDLVIARYNLPIAQ